MKTNLSIFNQLRPFTVGFDNTLDQFERMFDGDLLNVSTVNYPPYNIVRTGDNTYDVELALAGFGKDDINVQYAEDQLTIESVKREETEKEINDAVLHRGISKRHFTRSFTIADNVEVTGAELKNGLLTVALERIIPDAKKPRTIKIK
jgi:molecular chaperone IbpA